MSTPSVNCSLSYHRTRQQEKKQSKTENETTIKSEVHKVWLMQTGTSLKLLWFSLFSRLRARIIRIYDNKLAISIRKSSCPYQIWSWYQKRNGPIYVQERPQTSRCPPCCPCYPTKDGVAQAIFPRNKFHHNHFCILFFEHKWYMYQERSLHLACDSFHLLFLRD